MTSSAVFLENGYRKPKSDFCIRFQTKTWSRSQKSDLGYLSPLQRKATYDVIISKIAFLENHFLVKSLVTLITLQYAQSWIHMLHSMIFQRPLGLFMVFGDRREELDLNPHLSFVDEMMQKSDLSQLSQCSREINENQILVHFVTNITLKLIAVWIFFTFSLSLGFWRPSPRSFGNWNIFEEIVFIFKAVL